jgi:hypothetical protein
MYATSVRNSASKKIIFISSMAVYRFAPVGTDETGLINYFDDYGTYQMAGGRKIPRMLSSDTGDSLTIIRSTVIFGEQNRGECV